jgi:hypothetical protein
MIMSRQEFRVMLTIIVVGVLVIILILATG